MILESLFIAAAFAIWGYLLSHVLTQMGMVLAILPRLLPHNWTASKPIWSCAVCVAGFQCSLYVSALYCLGWLTLSDLPIYSLAPVLAMAGAYYLDGE